MKGKERVKRALTFNNPDRIPIFKGGSGDVFPMIDMPSKQWQPTERNVYPRLYADIIRKLRIYRWKRPDWAPKDWWKYDREEVDQWGCYWNKIASDVTMGHPGRPVLDSWDKLEAWEGPDTADKGIYKFFGRLAKLFPRRYKLALVHGNNFIFSRAHMLRGFSNLLIDHLRNPNQLHQLIKKITKIFLINFETWIDMYKPDGFWASDDLGTQEQLFFSPRIFKKFYEDPYKEIINFAHDHDCSFHLHSCGNISEIIPTLIDVGVDSIEFDSPRLNGFDELVQFRGKLPFWACVNIQSVYPNGTPENVEQEVIEMIKTFSTQEGGYLAYFYPDTKAINIPKTNIKAFSKALKKWGKYPLNCLS